MQSADDLRRENEALRQRIARIDESVLFACFDDDLTAAANDEGPMTWPGRPSCPARPPRPEETMTRNTVAPLDEPDLPAIRSEAKQAYHP